MGESLGNKKETMSKDGRAISVEVRGELGELVFVFHHVVWGINLRLSGLAVASLVTAEPSH